MTIKNISILSCALLAMWFMNCDSGDNIPSEDEIQDDIEDYIRINNLNVTESSSGLIYEIQNPGTPPKISDTDLIEIDLRGELADGTIIINTFRSETTLKWNMSNIPIPGLAEGLKLLATGGKATLILHPDLAYGAEGGAGVPGNSIIVYDIEVLGIYDDEADYSETLLSEYIAENELLTRVNRTSSGLYYIIDSLGMETPISSSQNVQVLYTGYLLDGEIFDSSTDRDNPFVTSLDNVIAGWTEGIPLFGVGGRGELLIPSQLAYGPSGAGDNSPIGSYTPIRFEVEFLGLNDN